MNLPMDAQGGEKLEMLAELYRMLLADALERNMLRDDYYYLSDDVLEIFERYQGCEADDLSMPRLKQAVMIWNQCPGVIREAILKAIGFGGNLPWVQLEEVLAVFDY